MAMLPFWITTQKCLPKYEKYQFVRYCNKTIILRASQQDSENIYWHAWYVSSDGKLKWEDNRVPEYRIEGLSEEIPDIDMVNFFDNSQLYSIDGISDNLSTYHDFKLHYEQLKISYFLNNL